MSEEAAAVFDRLVESFYNTWFRFHPEIAVDLGVPGHAGSLRPYDDDDIGALLALQEKLLAGLDEVEFNALDPDRQVDYRLLAGQALIEHHELLERDWRRRDPGAFLPVRAIYQLTVRAVEDPQGALQSRLQQIPAYLRGARSHIGQMPELIPACWLASACEEARAGAEFFRGLLKSPALRNRIPRRVAMTAQLDTAAHALEDFARYLEEELAPQAQGDFGVGRDHFERLLRHRHFLSVSAADLHGFGQGLFSRTLEDLHRLIRENWPDGDIQTITARLREKHPSAKQLVEVYREQMLAAREYVAGADLVTLPEKENLAVVETPIFMRHRIPFAAYMEPMRNDPEQQGMYYVTPAAGPELLGEHNYPGLRHTCVHEAWPGHHLQFVRANGRAVARTFPRVVNASATLYEGWALYCEQLMVEQGYLQGPEHRFVLLRDRLWRSLRVMLDVELHTRDASLETCAGRMQETLGFPRDQAMADLLWYTRAPTVPMGYAAGWAMINAARERARAGWADFSLKGFHDRILEPGSAAVSLGLRRAFDPEFAAGVLRDVFGATVAPEP